MFPSFKKDFTLYQKKEKKKKISLTLQFQTCMTSPLCKPFQYVEQQTGGQRIEGL